ncbi:MAG: universal stress protein [Proteobacteria bacterium]|nr:universal stress protein [Pseudomonadota bacterium]
MIKRILFASDFSGITANAERYTQDIARAMKAVVTVLHAVEPIADSEGDLAVEQFLASKRATASVQGEAVAERFRKAGVETELLVDLGKRWQLIVDTATEGSYDLVVLGSHRLHDGDKVYLGTTTHKVFFAADLPLLVVPEA